MSPHLVIAEICEFIQTEIQTDGQAGIAQLTLPVNLIKKTYTSCKKHLHNDRIPFFEHYSWSKSTL